MGGSAHHEQPTNHAERNWKMSETVRVPVPSPPTSAEGLLAN